MTLKGATSREEDGGGTAFGRGSDSFSEGIDIGGAIWFGGGTNTPGGPPK